jgi:hypothetical protein
MPSEPRAAEAEVTHAFGALLDTMLARAPGETLRELLVPVLDKVARCLEEGWSRQDLYREWVAAGGRVSYRRFCRVLRSLLAERDQALKVRRQAEEKKPGGNGAAGSPLLQARRSGGVGKTISTLRAEKAAALTRVAGEGGGDPV